MPSPLAATISAEVASSDSHEVPVWLQTKNAAMRMKAWVAAASSVGVDVALRGEQGADADRQAGGDQLLVGFY